MYELKNNQDKNMNVFLYKDNQLKYNLSNVESFGINTQTSEITVFILGIGLKSFRNVDSICIDSN